MAISEQNGFSKIRLPVVNFCFLILVTTTLLPVCKTEITQTEQGITQVIETVIGGVAKLPCSIEPPTASGSKLDDRMVLVIWFKGNTPIYSVDARGLLYDNARHWSDSFHLNGRADVALANITTTSASATTQDLNQDPAGSSADLIISPLQAQDAATYKCRVDFQKNPTRNAYVKLNVLEPPRRLTILDQNGAEVQGYQAGPYNVGDSVNMTCLSSGGRPAPKVTWWREHELLDDSCDTLPDGSVRNVLQLRQLTRNDANQVYTCQASNSHLVSPLSSVVKIQMKLSPLWVKLKGTNQPVSSGKTSTVNCEVVGASPPPKVSWSLGGTSINNTSQATSEDRNTTIGRASFIPSANDHGKLLTCYVDTEGKPEQESWRLNVLHSPVIRLTLGSPLRSQTVKKGSDIYLECHVKANPLKYTVVWKHNGHKISNNQTEGIISSNNSLVIQRISKENAGTYICQAENSQGVGYSNELALHVQYEPICATDTKTMTISSKQDVNITCPVRSYPHNNLKYTWKLNTNNITSNGSMVLNTTTSNEYLFNQQLFKEHVIGQEGTRHYSILCFAKNPIGQQEVPCETILQLAERPEPVKNCSFESNSINLFLIQCLPGYDGGTEQKFMFLIYDVNNGRLYLNYSSPIPILRANHLPSETDYKIQVTAFNAEGFSKELILFGTTLKPMAKKNVREQQSNIFANTNKVGVLIQLTPLLGALVGTVGTLIVVAICIVIMIRCKSKRKDEPQTFNKHDQKRQTKETTPEMRSQTSSASADKSLELLPHFSDDEYMQENRVLLRNPDNVNFKLKPAIKQDEQTCTASPNVHNFRLKPYIHVPYASDGELRTYIAAPNVYSHAPSRFRSTLPCLNSDTQSQRSGMVPLLMTTPPLPTIETIHNTNTS